MSTYITINRHTIAHNARHGDNQPPIAVRRTKSGKAKYVHNVEIRGSSRLLYSPDKPVMKCGARLVLITDAEVV